MRYDNSGQSICPVKMGQRIIVMNRPERAIVDNIQWVANEQRWRITLDWGQYGMSRIWSSDEGKIWQIYNEVN